MESTKDEQIIFLKDLVFAALYQWRKVLLVGLALALLLGGYTGLRFASGMSNSLPATTEELEAYEAEHTTLTQNVEQITENIALQKEYLRNSKLMALNPYQVSVGTLSVNINTEDDQAALPFLEAYGQILSTDTALAPLTQGEDGSYWKELVSVQFTSEGSLLNIVVYGDSQETADALLDIYEGLLAENKATVTNSVGRHTVSTVSRSVTRQVVQKLVDKQTQAENYLANLQKKLTDAKAALDALAAPSYVEITKGDALKEIILNAVIGGVLGVFLVCAWACVTHMFSGKVYSARTLHSRTGLKVLGCMPQFAKHTKLDRLLQKAEGRATQENLPLLTASLKNYCQDAKSVLLTSSERVPQVAALAEALTQTGLQVVCCGNLLTDAEAVAALPGCDAVVLVETCGSSRYANIGKICSCVSDWKKPLLGCILVNG